MKTQNRYEEIDARTVCSVSEGKREPCVSETDKRYCGIVWARELSLKWLNVRRENVHMYICSILSSGD